MRRLLLVTLIAACSHAPSGPAWPKTSDPDPDGGESIAPHVARAASAGASVSLEDDGDDEKLAVPAASSTSPAATTPEKKVEPAIIDDPLFDDFTIEIED